MKTSSLANSDSAIDFDDAEVHRLFQLLGVKSRDVLPIQFAGIRTHVEEEREEGLLRLFEALLLFSWRDLVCRRCQPPFRAVSPSRLRWEAILWFEDIDSPAPTGMRAVCEALGLPPDRVREAARGRAAAAAQGMRGRASTDCGAKGAARA